MKKNVLTTFILCCAAYVSFAQGVYFKLGGSYALPMGSQSMFEPVVSTTTIVGQSTVVTNSSESVNGSYGAGINISVSGGYKFTPFIGIDLNVSYLLGKEYDATTMATGGNIELEFNSFTESSGIFISPTALFMSGAGTVRPYALIGFTTGTVKIEDKIEAILGVRDSGIPYLLVQETKGEFAFGFRGGIGLDFNIASKFSLYAEAIFNSISYYAKEKNVTEYVIDNVDELSTLTVREKEIVFVDKITETSIDGNVAIDDDKPTQELRKPLPLSNISIGFGVKYRLSVD